MTIDEYIERHIDAEPPHLRALYRRTHLERLYPRMCTDHTQGRILAMLTAMIRPTRIVELGTFTGYSTLCMAEAMPAACHIDTVEVDPEYADDIRDTFAEAGHSDDITLHIGDALEVLPQLLATNTYDMAFVDANKRHYTEYFDLLISAMPSGPISSPTIPYGATRCSTKTRMTLRPTAYVPSTMLLQQTRL